MSTTIRTSRVIAFVPGRDGRVMLTYSTFGASRRRHKRKLLAFAARRGAKRVVFRGLPRETRQA